MNFSGFRYLVKQGWHSMITNRLMTLASMGVLTACLFITGVAVLLSINVNNFVNYLGTKNEIECFVADEYPEEQLTALGEQLAALENVATCDFVSKAQAIEEMKVQMGTDAGLLDAYAGEGNLENPLPASFRISIEDVSLLDQTVQQIQSVAGGAFYRVESPSEFSDMFIGLKQVVTIVGWGLVAVLGTVSVVVISNTIKLTVFARRKEINIMKFVGATNAFIRLPFFVEGMTVGALSGLVATGIVSGCYYAHINGLQSEMEGIASELISYLYPLSEVILPLLIGFVAFGMLIGSTGCATSIRKHLKV